MGPALADNSSWSRDFAPFGVGWANNAGTVNALGYRNGNIYIAGVFDRVGVVPARNIARYDGHQWHALGEGTNGAIYDMEVLDQAVSDVRGRQVARLLSGVQPAGRLEVAWDGRGARGRDVASGGAGAVETVAPSIGLE